MFYILYILALYIANKALSLYNRRLILFNWLHLIWTFCRHLYLYREILLVLCIFAPRTVLSGAWGFAAMRPLFIGHRQFKLFERVCAHTHDQNAYVIDYVSASLGLALVGPLDKFLAGPLARPWFASMLALWLAFYSGRCLALMLAFWPGFWLAF